mgnify:FL=1
MAQRGLDRVAFLFRDREPAPAVSTVGFGDIIPTTVAGRWVTILAVLVGFILIPWQVSRLRNPGAPTANCPRCGQAIDEPDRFCRTCGLELNGENQSSSSGSASSTDQSSPVRNE